MPEPSTWLRTAWEHGNPATRPDDRHAGGQARSTRNEVRPLVHGAACLVGLAADVRKLQARDHLAFTGWRGHADERRAGDGCISGSCQGAALDIASDRGASLRRPPRSG
jgi:hypothetical protein